MVSFLSFLEWLGCLNFASDMLGVIWSICSNVGDDNSLGGSESYIHKPWKTVGTREIKTSNMGEHALNYQRCPSSTC